MNRKGTGKVVKTIRTAKPRVPEAERAALVHLKRVHPELYAAAKPFVGTVLVRVQPKRTNDALFERLANSIVNQQLSTKAAASIYARLRSVLGGSVTPVAIKKAPPVKMRSAGLSEAKVKSLKDLAEAVLTNELNLLALKRLPTEEAVTKLMKVRGIGPWTAEMFLIFGLGAPDVFSPGDLILARRMQKLMRLDEKISIKEMARLAERWSPHRSFVSLLFWQLHHAEIEAKIDNA